MIDSIALAAVTAAVTNLATRAIEATASASTRKLWAQIKAMFGFEDDPNFNDLAIVVATRLSQDEELAKRTLSLLNASECNEKSLIAKIDADKVVVQNIQLATGPISINL